MNLFMLQRPSGCISHVMTLLARSYYYYSSYQYSKQSITMKTFQVKYEKKAQEISADSLDSFRGKIANVFGLDPIKLKITNPLMKDDNAFKNCTKKEVVVIGTKILKAKQELVSNPKQVVLSNPLSASPSKRIRNQTLIGSLLDEELYEEDAECYALFYLLYPVWQLRNWASRKAKKIKNQKKQHNQCNMWVKEFNRMYELVIRPKSVNKINFFAMSCTWANSRALRDIGCSERSHPADMIIELPDIIGVNQDQQFNESQPVRNLFTFKAEYKAEEIFIQDLESDNPDNDGKKQQNLILNPSGIFLHEEGSLSVKAYQKNIVHLNQLLNINGVQLKQGEEYNDTCDFIFKERFQGFKELPTYLFIHLNRFKPIKQNLQATPQAAPQAESKVAQQKCLAEIQYPKFIDVFDMCSQSYKQKNNASREKLLSLVAAHQTQIQEEIRNKQLQNSTELQLAFSAFDNGVLSQWQLEDMYNLCTDQYNKNSHTGGYNLVGFTTHKGQYQPEKSEYGTVFQFEKDIWMYCKGPTVKQISLKEALQNYRGSPLGTKSSEIETADLLMYRKVFIDEHY